MAEDTVSEGGEFFYLGARETLIFSPAGGKFERFIEFGDENLKDLWNLGTKIVEDRVEHSLALIALEQSHTVPGGSDSPIPRCP
jgi:hypothetical protein